MLRYEDALRDETAQMLARIVGERVRAERQLAGARLLTEIGATDRLLEVLEQPGVALTGRTLDRVDDAAAMAHGVVVDGRGGIRHAGLQDELVPSPHSRGRRGAADRTPVEVQNRSRWTRRACVYKLFDRRCRLADRRRCSRRRRIERLWLKHPAHVAAESRKHLRS